MKKIIVFCCLLSASVGAIAMNSILSNNAYDCILIQTRLYNGFHHYVFRNKCSARIRGNVNFEMTNGTFRSEPFNILPNRFHYTNITNSCSVFSMTVNWG